MIINLCKQRAENHDTWLNRFPGMAIATPDL
jgi:hypothetical protein